LNFRRTGDSTGFMSIAYGTRVPDNLGPRTKSWVSGTSSFCPMSYHRDSHCLTQCNPRPLHSTVKDRSAGPTEQTGAKKREYQYT
jgi:hypothetical protein